jgi:hypothetical protein
MIAQPRLSAALRGCSYLLSRRVAGILAALVVSAFLVQPVSGELIYGIANQSPATALVTFDSSNPSVLSTGVFLTGLQQNETILGIDFRPATGQLYGLGSTSRLYTINPATGVASAVGGQFATPLNGFSYGFDFIPGNDRIRVISETNQNLILNPDSGSVQSVVTDVAYNIIDPNFGVDPNVVDLAHTNNSQLYGIDTGLDILTQGATTLSTVGPLGVNVSAAGGFDISVTTGIAYAAFLPANASQSSLYTVNLANGAATLVGQIDGGIVITALAVAPVPEPTTAALILIGLAGAGTLGRRMRWGR